MIQLQEALQVQEGIWIDQEWIRRAGLGDSVRITVESGEIRIVSDISPRPKALVDKPRTWELCGTLMVAEPQVDYVISSHESGRQITNYAEHVDEVLYRGQ